MRVLFIGHTYHLKTKSSLFLLEMLREKCVVDEFYIDPDQKESYVSFEKFKGTHYDSVVIWQIMVNPQRLREYISWTTGCYFPMYDHFIAHSGLYNNLWKEYTDFTIINFCKAQHKEIEKAGFSSHYIQYFPKPQKVSDWGDHNSLFFWQRIDMPNLSTVAEALKEYRLSNIHIHKVLDPGHKYNSPKDFGHAVAKYFESINMSESEWFDSKSELHKILQKSSLYMAPRFNEGIGMSFLEAMSYGRCVISPNTPTMNEYIEDGKTGILYSWDENTLSRCGSPIDMTKIDIAKIQKNTLKYIEEGYDEWNKNKGRILDWIFETPQKDTKKLEKSSVLYGWNDWNINEQPWPDTSSLEADIETKFPQSGNTFPSKVDVTVITVVFNALKDGRKEMLFQNLDSVQAQKNITLEHLIVDGGSDDGTLELVTNYTNHNHPIRVISKPDKGIYDAMNRGIALAKGEYIIFLNSDDFYHNPNGIGNVVSKLRKSLCAFSFSPITVIDNNLPDNPHITPLRFLHNIFLHSVFSHQSIIAKKSVMLSMHGFDLSYKSAADYDFVLRMILMGYKGIYVDENFVSYRMIGISSTNLNLSAHETALVYKRLYNKYVGAHLTEQEAYALHKYRIVPTRDRDILKKLNKKAKKTFDGIPQKPKYSYRKEYKFIWKCIFHGRLRLLRNFLIILLNSRFDSEWYLETYKEVGVSKYSPAEHYMLFGWKEGRDPSLRFSTKGYLEKNPDVEKAGICPLIHWKLKGKREKRKW